MAAHFHSPTHLPNNPNRSTNEPIGTCVRFADSSQSRMGMGIYLARLCPLPLIHRRHTRLGAIHLLCTQHWCRFPKIMYFIDQSVSNLQASLSGQWTKNRVEKENRLLPGTQLQVPNLIREHEEDSLIVILLR